MSIKPVLISEFSLKDFGCQDLWTGDLNDDGKTEILIRQSAGFLSSHYFNWGSETYPTHIHPDDQKLFCLTALDLKGNILWQLGESWKLERTFRNHGGYDMCTILDVDGDGKTELIYFWMDQVIIAEGSTGKTLRQLKLPDDNFAQIVPCKVRGDSKSWDLIIKPQCWSLPIYANPVMVVDGDLNVLLGPEDYWGVGHQALVVDANNDGKDELFLGYALFDGKGKKLWELPELFPDFASKYEGYERMWRLALRRHIDNAILADIDADGRPEIAICIEDEDGMVVDLDGNIRWRTKMEHCQMVTAGNFLDKVPGQQVLFDERINIGGSVLYDGTGNEIWKINNPRYSSRIGWETEVGKDAIVQRTFPYDDPGKDVRPIIVDGSGRTVATLPVEPTFADYIRRCKVREAGDDGAWYTDRAADVNSDGVEELIIASREKLYIFAKG